MITISDSSEDESDDVTISSMEELKGDQEALEHTSKERSLEDLDEAFPETSPVTTNSSKEEADSSKDASDFSEDSGQSDEATSEATPVTTDTTDSSEEEMDSSKDASDSSEDSGQPDETTPETTPVTTDYSEEESDLPQHVEADPFFNLNIPGSSTDDSEAFRNASESIPRPR